MLLAGSIYGQSSTPDGANITAQQRQEANTYFIAQDWTRASEAYRRISSVEDNNAGAFYRLGVSLYKLKQLDAALTALLHSEKISAGPYVEYNIACVHTLLKNNDMAFTWLEKAIASGYTNIPSIRTDPDLAGLRADNRFAKMEMAAEKAASPCKYDPTARQFDFWVGNWEVKNKMGVTAGTNKILLLENGCIIEENWTSKLGGTGKSFNFYDKDVKKWRQVWIDSTGDSTIFTGDFKEGSLVLLASTGGQNGKAKLSRLTFTPLPNGTVRQHGESSDDEGATWKTTYDLIYEKNDSIK